MKSNLTGSECVNELMRIFSKELLEKSGSSWSKVKSWTGSAEDGSRASAGGSVTISRGTYKVISVGKVANETTSKETTAKTY